MGRGGEVNDVLEVVEEGDEEGEAPAIVGDGSQQERLPPGTSVVPEPVKLATCDKSEVPTLQVFKEKTVEQQDATIVPTVAAATDVASVCSPLSAGVEDANDTAPPAPRKRFTLPAPTRKRSSAASSCSSVSGLDRDDEVSLYASSSPSHDGLSPQRHNLPLLRIATEDNGWDTCSTYSGTAASSAPSLSALELALRQAARAQRAAREAHLNSCASSVISSSAATSPREMPSTPATQAFEQACSRVTEDMGPPMTKAVSEFSGAQRAKLSAAPKEQRSKASAPKKTLNSKSGRRNDVLFHRHS